MRWARRARSPASERLAVILRQRAPAKVNLNLHVGRLRPDGYHPLSSLMVFADAGDLLEAAPAGRLELAVEGPFAGLAPADDDNLVLEAARATLGEDAPWALRLHKALPVGAGLGGGSSDAAAALRMLGAHLPNAALQRLAAGLGSDVPACVGAGPVIAEGRGERLSAAPPMAPTPAVLVWPGRPCATAAVYRAFDTGERPGTADRAAMPDAFERPRDVADFVLSTRNDLEAPAIAVEPAVGEALALLRAAPETLAARMSGSGSACFAVCAGANEAEALAARVAADRPGWWVRACRLGGPWD
jgi:4-diphosphocytidyl-2-C-methyl-D-erythritol kinase